MINKDTEVIEFLIEHKDKELNILAVSNGLKIDYKNAYTIVSRLEKEKVVKLESFGASRRVKLTPQLHPIIFEAEYNRRKALLKDKNLAVAWDELKKGLEAVGYIALIFGSYAKGTQTKKSDIDILFIVPDRLEDRFEKRISRIIRSLPLSIHTLVFSETQFLEMRDAKQANVVHEAMKSNIIVHGIETYYDMGNK